MVKLKILELCPVVKNEKDTKFQRTSVKRD